MPVFGHTEELLQVVSKWKSSGDKIVFTNGVFDILHLGHVTYLEKAKSYGQRLIVGINDDASVKRLNKGPERPINPHHARAAVIAALRCVDAVVIFSDDTPLQLILACMPDVLVKGGDYDPSERNPQSKKYIVGSDQVIAAGGKVIAIDLVQGYSTTNIVERISGK
jgi:rfaE bifunctional protein nucleotidyltransferase chain/domain